MDYDFLYDKARNLLTIGYNATERRCDASYYDLLASEARLCSFVAIAQGQLPQENWFALGRLLTTAGGEPILLSWSGSMFEYLMPLLVMPTYENTLLDQTCKAAVHRQIEYGKARGGPWGISESGYNTIDVHLNYQYRAFGVPGLGLKRGLAEDLVIAPYASALALMVSPEEACLNLQLLHADGLEGRYGFYEAIDYTPSRVPRGQSAAVVRSFMAHHEGMSLLSLAYLLLDRPMQRRFESDPLFQATMLLLQERIPKATAFYSHTAEPSLLHAGSSAPEAPVRVFNSPDTPMPEVHLLSNGRYHVMITNAGGGYSRWKDIAVTRWREDTGLRQLGHVLLRPRRGKRRVLVDSVSADAESTEDLRSDFFGRARRVPLRRPRIRHAHGDRRFARGRYRAAARHHHQPFTDAPGDRCHQLRGGGPGFTRRRCAASGIQQSFCADRDHPRAAGDSLHAAAPLPRRASALDVSPDGRAWSRYRRSLL